MKSGKPEKKLTQWLCKGKMLRLFSLTTSNIILIDAHLQYAIPCKKISIEGAQTTMITIKMCSLETSGSTMLPWQQKLKNPRENILLIVAHPWQLISNFLYGVTEWVWSQSLRVVFHLALPRHTLYPLHAVNNLSNFMIWLHIFSLVIWIPYIDKPNYMLEGMPPSKHPCMTQHDKSYLAETKWHLPTNEVEFQRRLLATQALK